MVTMVGPAHLELLGSVENVAIEKGAIAEALGPDGVYYLNNGDPWCVRIAERHAGETVVVGEGGEVALRGWQFGDDGNMLLDIAPIGPIRLPLAVPAHIPNILLAIAVALRHGCSEFEGPLRRACDRAIRFRVERIGPLDVLDDSYNANPASMRAALEALALRPGTHPRIAVLGDMLELGDDAERMHRELGAEAASRNVTTLIAYGSFADAIVSGARQAGLGDAATVAGHAEAVRRICDIGREGASVLVKGSRGAAMERVVEGLRELLAPSAASVPSRNP